MHSRFAALALVCCCCVAQFSLAQEPQLRYLEGHQGAVRDVAITADGRMIVSAGVDGTLRLWDRLNGQLLRAMPAHDRAILSFELSPDGSAVALAAASGRVKLLELPRHYPLSELAGFPLVPDHLVVTRDGQQIVTGDGSEVLRLFDLAKKQPVREFGGAIGGIIDLGLANDGQQLLAASGDGHIRGWNLADGQPSGSVLLSSPSQLAASPQGATIALAGADGAIRLANWPPVPAAALASHGDQVSSIAMTADGKTVLSGGLDQQVLLNSEGVPVKALAGAGSRLMSVSLSADGLMAAAGTEAGLVPIWRNKDGTVASVLAGHTGAVTSVAFHPQRPLLASAGADGTVRIWRHIEAPLAWSGHTQPATMLAVSTNGKQAVSAGADNSVRLWNSADGQSLALWENLPQPVTAAVFAASGEEAFLGDAAGNLTLRRIADGQTRWSLPVHAEAIVDMVLVAEGKLATTGADGQIKLWNLAAMGPPERLASARPTTAVLSLADGTIVAGGLDGSLHFAASKNGKTLGHADVFESPVTALAASSDGSLLFAGGTSGDVAVLKTADRTEQARFTAHAGKVRAIAVHPQVSQFATSGDDGAVRLWNLPLPPQELAGHQAAVSVLAVSPDGKQAISGDASGALHRWNLPEGTPADALPSGKAALTSTAFRRDGQELASGDASGTIRLLDTAEGTQLGTIGAHQGEITSLSFHPAGTQLLSSGKDGVLRLWQLPLIPPKQVAKGEQRVGALAVTGDGATAVISSADKRLSVVDLATGQERIAIEAPAGVAGVAISPDNSQAAFVTEQGTLHLSALADGKTIGEVGAHVGAATAVAFRPQGGQIATAGSDGQLRLWEIHAMARQFSDHTARIAAVAVSPNGQWLATAGADKTVRLWNVADGTASWTLGHAEGVSAIAWKPDSTQIAAASRNIVQVWNTADGQRAAVLDKHAHAVKAIAFAADGAALYTAGKAIQQWNLADGELLRSLGDADQGVNSLTLVSAGTLLVAASDNGAVTIWNTATGTRQRHIASSGPIAGVAASGDGRWLAIAVAKQGIQLYDLVDGALAQTMDFATAGCLAFSGDHLSLAGGAADGSVQIWNLQGELQEFIPASDSPPTAVAFLPDHRQVAVGYDKGLVRICRRALVRAIAVAEAPVTSVAWSADGQFVLTAAGDKTLKLWNAADSSLARQYFGHADVPRCVWITKDGTKVVAGCDDKSLRVWNYSDGSLTATMLLEDKPQSLVANADGSRIAVAESRQVKAWDLASQRMSEQIDIAATALAMLPDGKQLVIGDAAGLTQRLALANLAVAVAHAGGTAGAALSADGQRWFSAGSDKSVKVWDAVGKPQAALGVCDGDPVAVAIRGDRLQLAVAGDDRQLYLWRLDSNQLERKFSTSSRVVALAHHPSLPRLVAACADGRLRLFDTTSGALLETVDAPDASCVAFAGDRLLVGRADHSLRLYSLSLLRTLAGHQGGVGALAYAADGASLFSAGDDKTVRQWNVADGAALRVVLTAADVITGVALCEKGTRLVATSADKTVRLHNVADGALVATYNSPAPIRSLAIAPGGDLIATSGDDKLISIWDARTGVVRETLSGLTSPSAGLAFLPDGQRVLAATSDAGLQAWPMACTAQFAADAAKIHDLAVTPDGTQLITGGEDKLVKLWDAEGKLIRPFLGSTFAPRNIAVRPDGKQIVAGGDPSQTQPQLLAWNFADGQTQFSITLPSPIIRVAYLDEGRIAVACVDQKLRVLSAADGKLIEERQLPSLPVAMAATPSAKSLSEAALVVAGADNQLYRLEPALLRVMAAHEGGVAAVAWSAAGDELFTAGADKLIRQWNAVSGEPLRTLTHAPAAVTGVTVSADGLRVITAGDDQKLRIWDLSAGESNLAQPVPPTNDIPHPAAVRSLACSADGQRIVVGGEDGLVRVWDAASGKELERFAGHAGPVLCLAVNSSGSLVASGGADKTVRRTTTFVTSLASSGDGASTACAFSPDGSQVILATAAGKLAAWSAQELSLMQEYPGTVGTVRSIAVSKPAPDASADFAGGLLAAGGDDMHLRVWSANEGTLLADLMTHVPITGVQFARGGRLLIASGTDGILRHYELSRGDDKLTLELSLQARGHVGAIRRLVLPADDGFALSVAADGKIFSWRLAERRPRWERELSKQAIGALAFAPDGKALVAAGLDGMLRELSTADGSTTREWQHNDGVLALAFRPDGQELASGGRDGTVRIWDAVRKEAAKVALAPTGAAEALEWSADGTLLHAAGRSKLWQTFERGALASGQPARQSEGHNHAIVALRYSANRQRVATLDDSGKLFVWDAASGAGLFHQQLAVTAAYDLAWSPDASEIAVATSDPRVLRVALPAAAR